MLLRKSVMRHTSLNEPHEATDPVPPREVEYFQFPKLSGELQITHAVYTRHGGTSAPPFDTLNTSYHTGDNPAHVKRNLHVIKDALGARDLVYLDQMHGRDILVLRNSEIPWSGSVHKADALITNMPNVALMVKQADCQAVLLFDPMERVISNVHCGWRGNVQNILGSVVERMKSEFGCKAPHLMAGIGPSLGPCCTEFVTHDQIFPETFRPFLVRKNHFDLWEISRRQLMEAGLESENIEVGGICTRCRTDLFFSHRAEGTTGRFATLVMLT